MTSPQHEKGTSQPNGSSPSSPSSTAELSPIRKEWKLEESSLWWLSLDFFQNPGNILLLTSVPFCMGAYYGSIQPAERLEEWVGDDVRQSQSSRGESSSSSSSNRPVATAARRALERESETMAARQLGVHTAARALSLATMGTFATFTLVGAGRSNKEWV